MEFYRGQFDFFCNASSSLASIWSLGFFSSYILNSLYTWLFIVYAIRLAELIYRNQKNILLMYQSEIIHLSRYIDVILNYYLVTNTKVVDWTQSTSFFVWLPSLLSVLVRVLAKKQVSFIRNIIKLAKILV